MTSTLPIRIPQDGHAQGGSHTMGPTSGSRPGQGEGSAHAKAILFGEHAVVYGAPAITIPIHELEAEVRVESAHSGVRIESELYSGDVSTAPVQLQPVVTAIRAALARVDAVEAGVRVQILSAIPHSRGLGSSAAVAAAVARGVADWADFVLDEATLYDIVQEAERVAHGNPSGIDARSVTSDRTIRFDFGAVTPLHIGAPFNFVLADSGIAGSTAEAVGGVRSRRDREPHLVEPMIARLAEITEGSVDDLARGDRLAVGERMRESHELLDRLGVSSAALNHLVDSAYAEGALGAKLTGGGLGGCILVLADSAAHAEQLAITLRAAGAKRTWTATVPVA